MIMADIFKFLFLILGTCTIVVCYWLLFEALAPGAVERARRRYVDKPFRSILAGVMLGGPPLAIGLALAGNAGPLKALGFVIIFALILFGLLGSTGLARHVGQRLNSPADTTQPWRRVLRGGTVITIACVLPFVGWFALLPLVLISGIGTAVLSLWEGRRAVAIVPPMPS